MNRKKPIKSNSSVWNYFTEKASDSTGTEKGTWSLFTCNICSEEVRNDWRNTTYFWRHLRSDHSEIAKDIIPARLAKKRKKGLVRRFKIKKDAEWSDIETTDASSTDVKHCQLALGSNKKLSIPKTRAPIWQYFSFVTDEEGKAKDRDSPVCNLCSQVVKRTCRNTRAMQAHILKSHPAQHAKLQRKVLVPGLSISGLVNNCFNITAEATNVVKCKYCSEKLQRRKVVLLTHLRDHHRTSYLQLARLGRQDNVPRGSSSRRLARAVTAHGKRGPKRKPMIEEQPPRKVPLGAFFKHQKKGEDGKDYFTCMLCLQNCPLVENNENQFSHLATAHPEEYKLCTEGISKPSGNLVKFANAKSKLWDYFLIEEGRKRRTFAFCIFCKKVIIMSGLGTGRLYDHLSRCNPQAAADARKTFHRLKGDKQQSADSSFTSDIECAVPVTDTHDAAVSSTSEYSSWKQDSIVSSKEFPLITEPDMVAENVPSESEEAPAAVRSSYDLIQETVNVDIKEPIPDLNTEAVVDFLAAEMLPVSFLERPSFVALIEALRKIDIPSVDSVKNRLNLVLQRSCESRTIAKIAEASNLSLALDCWATDNKDQHVTMILNAMYSDFTRKTFVLDSCRLPIQASNDVFVSTMQSSLAYWNLSSYNLSTAVVKLSSIGQQMLNGCVERIIPCFSSVWHDTLCAALNIPLVSTAVQKARDLALYFTTNVATRSVLRGMQRSIGLIEEDLTFAVCDDWLSTYLMLQGLDRNLEAIMKLITSDDNLTAIVPSKEDIEDWKVLLNILKPMAELNSAFHFEEHICVSTIAPFIHTVTTEVLLIEASDRPVARLVKETLHEGLSKEYREPKLRKHLLICTFLDPRFRNQGVDGLELAREEVSEMIRIRNSTSLTPREVEAVSAPKRKSLLSTLAGMSRTKVAEVEAPQPLDEIQRYLNAERCGSDASPFAWWRDHGCQFKNLATLANRFLCSQATSRPSHRSFPLVDEFSLGKRPFAVAQSPALVFWQNRVALC